MIWPEEDRNGRRFEFHRMIFSLLFLHHPLLFRNSILQTVSHHPLERQNLRNRNRRNTNLTAGSERRTGVVNAFALQPGTRGINASRGGTIRRQGAQRRSTGPVRPSTPRGLRNWIRAHAAPVEKPQAARRRLGLEPNGLPPALPGNHLLQDRSIQGEVPPAGVVEL